MEACCFIALWVSAIDPILYNLSLSIRKYDEGKMKKYPQRPPI